MGWHIEVNVREQNEWNWLPLRPTHGAPYEFASKTEAEITMHAFYPDSIAEIDIRAKEVICRTSK